MTPEMMLAKMLSTESKMEEKTASVDGQDSLDEAKEKLAWAEEMGRGLARRDFEKIAVTIPGAGALMSSIKSGVGQGMLRTMQASGGTRAAVGAGVGAAGGGLAGAMKDPGVDPATGQKRSRMGNIASGMAGGAALGAGAGLGARKAVGAVASSKGAVGQAARGAMTQGAEAARVAASKGAMTPQVAKQFAKDTRQIDALKSMAGEATSKGKVRAGLGTAARQNVAAGPQVRTKGGVPGQAPPVKPTPAVGPGTSTPVSPTAPVGTPAPPVVNPQSLSSGSQATLQGVAPQHQAEAARRLAAREARNAGKSTVDAEGALARQQQKKVDSSMIQGAKRALGGGQGMRLASFNSERVDMQALYREMMDRLGR